MIAGVHIQRSHCSLILDLDTVPFQSSLDESIVDIQVFELYFASMSVQNTHKTIYLLITAQKLENTCERVTTRIRENSS
jgi:hypothetical protein